MGQQFGHLLSIVSLIKKVQLQRHVLFGLLNQPHECKVWEQQVDPPQQNLPITPQELRWVNSINQLHLLVRITISVCK